MQLDANNLIEITVVMTALNEEENIKVAIGNTLKAFEDFNIKGEIIVVNDGSNDGTGELIESLMENDSRIRIIIHSKPKGIGTSFWEGVDIAKGKIVTWFPADNENDPWEIFRYYKLLEHVDIVIPFVFNKEVRSPFRNILSSFYRYIINNTFRVNFNYTNGTILYRRSILKGLDYRSNGFFFQADILVRLAKKGYLFAEVPYKTGLRKFGITKAITFSSLLQVINGYLRLVKDYYFKTDTKTKVFTSDSVSLTRYNE